MMHWESKLFSRIFLEPFKRDDLSTEWEYLKNEYNLAELFYLHIAVRTYYCSIVLYSPSTLSGKEPVHKCKTNILWNYHFIQLCVHARIQELMIAFIFQFQRHISLVIQLSLISIWMDQDSCDLITSTLSLDFDLSSHGNSLLTMMNGRNDIIVTSVCWT